MRLHKSMLAVAFLCCGCGTAIRVTNSEKHKIDGIPFYAKVAACKHETVWLVPTYKLTLVEITPAPATEEENQTAENKTAGKEVSKSLGVRLISLETYTSDDFRKMAASIENDTNQPDEGVVRNWFLNLPQTTVPGHGLPAAEERILASNENVPVVMVNYATTYYYNVKRPILGSVSATAELNADGTLSKGSAQIEDKTLQAILDLLPVKELASAAATGAIAPLARGRARARLKLIIEPQVDKYTLSQAPKIVPGQESSFPCPAPTATLDEIQGNNFSRTTVAAADSADKTDSQQKVKFAGTVQLPKADDAKKPPAK